MDLRFSFSPSTGCCPSASTTSSSGTSQKEPKTYKVGTTSGAPVAGTSTWTRPEFANSYVVLILARSVTIDMNNMGDGDPYLTKVLTSEIVTINNYVWQTGDIVTAIIITP